MKFIVVDDDIDFRARIGSLLRREYREAEVENVESEEEFYKVLENCETNPAPAFIVDLMLPWSSDVEVLAPSGKPQHNAGMRLLRKIAEHEDQNIRNAGVLLMSAAIDKIEAKEVPVNTIPLDKRTSEDDQIIECLNGLTFYRVPRKKKSWVIELLDWLEDIGFSFFGINISLKKPISWIKKRIQDSA